MKAFVTKIGDVM